MSIFFHPIKNEICCFCKNVTRSLSGSVRPFEDTFLGYFFLDKVLKEK
jgi:hypothetical protein